MSINERSVGSVTILDLVGRLTYTAGMEMGQRVQTFSQRGPLNVVLNLEQVSYVDSAGLGAMVEAFTRMRNGGGALKFLNPTARTRHLLDITGLATLVSTYTDEASVVASFA